MLVLASYRAADARQKLQSPEWLSCDSGEAPKSNQPLDPTSSAPPVSWMMERTP